MKRFLHTAFIGLRRYILAIILTFTYFSTLTSVNAQINESYNDGSLRLRVWLHAVYSDANCSENIIKGPTMFVYNKIKIRASNGSPGYKGDNFPGGLFPQDMRFRVKGNTNRFWRTNDGQFKMLNPYYPFEDSRFSGNVYIPKANSEAAPLAPGVGRPVGIDNPNTNGFLLYDNTFTAGSAPDRYEWQVQDIFESDADIASGEAGFLICNKAFGLPQYYEGRKNFLPYDPLMTLLIFASRPPADALLWGVSLGGCLDFFGFGSIDPTNVFNIIASTLGIGDWDESLATKRTWNNDPAFFRGSTPGSVGYYTSLKMKSTDNSDGAGEGYILVFAHQWEWIGADAGFPEPTGPVTIQKKLCPTEQYTDGPINLEVYLDGYFTDVDHEGSDLPLIGGLLGCSDIGIGPGALTGNEEKYIRARASNQFTGMPGWSPTIKTSQDNPDWIKTNQPLLNYTFTSETGMNTFNYELESWESDCFTDNPTNCNVCLFGGNASDDCCRTRAPSWLGGFCIWPPYPTNELSKISASDFDHRATAFGTVNWRNSPPSTDNFIYVPVQISTSRFNSHLARLRYRWSIPNPDAGSIDGVAQKLLCAGQTYTMSASAYKNATWFQWQYADVPTLNCPPAYTVWTNIPEAQGGTCPKNYTTQVFSGTRAYRLLVYNRDGDGSRTPYGDKFLYDSTVCTIVSIIDSLQVPIDGPFACGTSSNPTPVRAGSSISLRPVLPPNVGSTDIPGVIYEWSSVGGTISTPNPVSSPWETNLSFPSSSPTPVSVTLLTNVHPKCPLNPNYDTTCYYVTEDPGCSGTTGVVYVSYLATPGGIGTITRPYTLEDAFALVNTDPNIKHVKILAGDYVIDSTNYGAMKLTDNLVVEGNYVKRIDTESGEEIWVKKSDTITNITSNIIETINPALSNTIGFRAIGNNWILQDVNITTGNSQDRDAILTLTPGLGLSNYAIHINASTGWKMINVTAVAGQAGKGSKGPNRTDLECVDATSPAQPTANNASYAGGVSTNNSCPDPVYGDRGGGQGGAVLGIGTAASYNGTTGGSNPTAGLGGAPNVAGNVGRIGDAGTAVADVILTDLTGTYYIPKTFSTAAANRGHNGGGGGGGGGSAAFKGAAGGYGGRGGNSGYGSGGAFGIWLSTNSSGVTTNSVGGVAVLTGRDGGDGGDGTSGYPGGLAGGGAGAGGFGGAGGQGGPGARGGVSGSNMGEFVQPGSTMTPVTPSYPPPRVESDYNSGCTNSKIVISKVGGVNWTALVSSLDYPDIAPAKSSTPNATDSPKFIYYPTGSLGAKNLQTSSGEYQNQVYVRYERPLPTITVPAKVCYNTSISFSSTPGMADPIDHEWVVQANVPLPNGIYTSPVPVYQVQGVANPSGIILPNATAASVFYQVRYRVRDNCCGWSIPIYSTIEVLPQIKNFIVPNADSIICNTGNPAVITSDPVNLPPVGPTWTYTWYESYNGAPFTPIAVGGTSQTYDPPILSATGTYQYKRVIGNTLAVCGDTSNIVTITVTNNFQDNSIAFPVPFIAQCALSPMPAYNLGTQLSVANTDIGFMNGSTPTGPGNSNTFYYQWQVSPTKTVQYSKNVTVFDSIRAIAPFDSVFKTITVVSDSVVYTWANVGAGWPSQSGLPVGIGSGSQSWDPGVLSPSGGYNYGAANYIFPQGTLAGAPGYVAFRRIVRRKASDVVCADTSNFVLSEILPGVTPWGQCALLPNNSSAALCGVNYPAESALYGYSGTCIVQAPDTICPGSVTLTLPTTQINGIRGIGTQFAWYSVTGGPFNRFLNIGNSCNTLQCTNPMLSDNCKTVKPKSTFRAFAPYDTNGTSISVILDTTTTFYVNSVDQCFDTTTFKTTGTPETYSARWQRKTVVVITPFTYLDRLDVTDSILCTGVTPPTTLTFTIVGGDLGNDAQFVIYDTDPTVGGPHTPIFQGGKRNDTARHLTIPIPSVTTTYYARMENRCDTSAYVSRTINFLDPSLAPTSLTGPNLACNETITLTTNGGSLGDSSNWVLYKGLPLNGANKIATNKTGIFSVTPTATTTYYVRAESIAPSTCPYTDSVSKLVTYTDTCVCETTPGIIQYAPTGVTTIATVECTASDGWTYYAESTKPEIYLFAIQKTPGSAPTTEATGNTVPFNAICSLTVTANPTTTADVFYNEDLSICEANFVMTRYWNVSYVGAAPTLNGFVRIRFYFPPGELAATIARANAWQALHNMATCGLPLSVGPPQVFKTNDGTPFNPNVLAGKVPIISDILPTTINNFNYVAYLLSALGHSDTYPQTMMGKNYVQVAWEGFSGGGVAVRVSPDIIVLPVTLLYFTGSMVEDQVHLNWETASELNNDYFIVEKSSDASNWTNIGSVKGHGTTNTPNKYQLIDGQPFNGKNYYRLRQVDFDGKVSYSRVIVIEVNNTKTYDNSFTVLPNPTSGPVVATIVSNTDQNVNMRILDVSGRLMGNKDIALVKGVNQLKLDLTKYPAATYILSYKDSNGQDMNAKVVKQ
jgi:hypothetical protein